jgi:tetratricopeptide (TPR) repeat protein
MDKARADIDLSITIDPYNGWAYRNKGIYYLMEQKYNDAVRLLKRAESGDSFIEKIYFFLGQAYEKQHDRRTACEYYAKAVDRMEMDVKTYESKCQ